MPWKILGALLLSIGIKISVASAASPSWYSLFPSGLVYVGLLLFAKGVEEAIVEALRRDTKPMLNAEGLDAEANHEPVVDRD